MTNIIKQLETDEEWREGLQLLRQLRPDLDISTALAIKSDLSERAYKLFGLFHDSKISCVAGVAIQPHITRKNELWVHDLVTSEAERGSGFGAEMMRFLEQFARDCGCNRLSVHTRISRERAQNFYENHLGYDRYAVVFQREIDLTK